MKKFKNIYIEITNICNLSCSFCIKTKRTPQFMDLDLFKKIIQEISPYTKYVYFHILGEPLLHKKIESFINICEEYNIKVNLTTNGTLIKNFEQNLTNKNSINLINFSLHSFEANNNITNINQYLEDIFNYIDIVNNRYSICLRLWNLGIDSLEKNNYILEKIKQKFNLDNKIEEKITSGNGIKLKEKIYLQLMEYFKWPDINNTLYTNTGFCYALRNHVGILVDGTVVPCCLDSEGTLSLGNIKNTPFKNIITNEKAIDMYDNFSKRNLKNTLCKTCGYIQTRKV